MTARPATRHASRVVILAFCWIVVTVSGLTALGRPLFKQRFRDLGSIRTALEAYKAANGAYPKAAAAIVGQADQPDQTRWIPGLAPNFIAAVPRDPRHLPQSNKQYLYISDGADFKIIAHGAEDAGWVNKHHPAMADPRRPGFAYGYWSSGAASW